MATKKQEQQEPVVTTATTEEELLATKQPVTLKEIWNTLSPIDCTEHVEIKKAGDRELKYLSWAWAWGILKKHFPNSTYEVREWNERPYLYDENLGYLVHTSLTIEGITQSMRLPVMDGANKALKSKPYQFTVKNPNFKWAKWDNEKNGYFDKFGNQQTEYLTKIVASATMFDINTAIMRCLVKNMALFGLGHYIYAGEDLPCVETVGQPAQQEAREVSRKEADQRAMEAIADINAATDGESYAAVKQRYMNLLTGNGKHPAVVKAAQLKYQQLFNNNQN